MRRILAAVTILVALSLVVSAQEQKHAPSTPEERERAVKVAQALEARPTDPTLRDDYGWLLRWVAEVPDISVSVCSANMPWKEKYKYSGELAAVGLAATVSFVIQHPDEGKDPASAGLAAMESMLTAYQKIVAQDPKGHSKEMDAVVEIQRQGKISEYVHSKWTESCKKKVAGITSPPSPAGGF